jgi:hypothetical protein
MGIENTSGRLALLRVHDRGTKFGPPSDQIDVEVVIQIEGQTRFYGFQLRDDSNGPAREGMLGLLRDGFNHNWIVNCDFDIKAGKKNGRIIRVWLTKPKQPGKTTGGVLATAKTRRTSKTTARKKPAPRRK